MKKLLALGIIVLCTALLLSACSTPEVTTLEGAEKDAVLAYAEPAADTLMTAINTQDYALFSSLMDEAMLKQFNETQFNQLCEQLIAKIGGYISRTVSSVSSTQTFIIVIYNTEFEQESDVLMRLVFQPEGAHNITGLWFDSPTLRGK